MFSFPFSMRFFVGANYHLVAPTTTTGMIRKDFGDDLTTSHKPTRHTVDAKKTTPVDNGSLSPYLQCVFLSGFI